MGDRSSVRQRYSATRATVAAREEPSAGSWDYLTSTEALAALEGLGSLLGGLLGDLLEDGLRSAVDEVLGLLQAQRGQLTHDLDDLDLLLIGTREDDVELVLLLSGLDGGG